MKAITSRNNKSYELSQAKTLAISSHLEPLEDKTNNNITDEEDERPLSPYEIAKCTPPARFPQALYRGQKKTGPPIVNIYELFDELR